MFDHIITPEHDLEINQISSLNRKRNHYGEPVFLPVLGGVTMPRNLFPFIRSKYIEENSTIVLMGGPTTKTHVSAARFIEVRYLVSLDHIMSLQACCDTGSYWFDFSRKACCDLFKKNPGGSNQKVK